MTNLELQRLLEEVFNETFLNQVLLLKSKEKEYKQSVFYKEARIDLFDLYKNYYVYYNNRYGIANKINEFIYSLDTDTLYKQIMDLVESLLENDKVEEFIERVINAFDFDKILEQNEELNNLIQKLKK